MGEKTSQGPLGKLAARAKVTQVKPKCPGCGGEAEHVLYFPARGKSKKALHCPRTGDIYINGVLVDEAPA